MPSPGGVDPFWYRRAVIHTVLFFCILTNQHSIGLRNFPFDISVESLVLFATLDAYKHTALRTIAVSLKQQCTCKFPRFQASSLFLSLLSLALSEGSNAKGGGTSNKGRDLLFALCLKEKRNMLGKHALPQTVQSPCCASLSMYLLLYVCRCM